MPTFGESWLSTTSKGHRVGGIPPKTGPGRSSDRSTRIERPTGTPSDTRGFLISLVSQLLPSIAMNSAHVRAIERRRCRFRQRRLLSSTSPARSGSTFPVRSWSSSFRIGVFFQTTSRQAFPSPQYDFFELSFDQGHVFQRALNKNNFDHMSKGEMLKVMEKIQNLRIFSNSTIYYHYVSK